MDEIDVSRVLHDISRGPVLPDQPVDVARTVRRVHHGRAVRATGVAAACTAAVVGIATVVYAVAPWQEPLPPADPTPVVTPSRTPDPPRPSTEPRTPEPEPVATADDALLPPPIVAITSGGDVVELDPTSGAVTRAVIQGLEGTWGRSSLSPDRRALYAARALGAGPWEVVRISLVDRSVTPVAIGYDPAVSPDGRQLAFAGGPRDAGQHESGLNVLDLDSGANTFVVVGECAACDRPLGPPAWSADGSQVLMPYGWSDEGYHEKWIAVVDVAKPPVTLDAASSLPVVAGADEGWDAVDRFGDGTLAVAGYGPEPYVAVVRDGAEVARLTVTLWIEDVLAEPGGHRVVFRTRSFDHTADQYMVAVTLWDPSSGQTTNLAEGIASIAW